MQRWKRALIFSSLGAGVALFVSGRRVTGVALTSLGLGGLVFENRKSLGKVVRDLPGFLEKSSQVMETVATVGERLMEATRYARRA